MSLDAVAPISERQNKAGGATALKAPATAESPVLAGSPKLSDAERDSSFQRLMKFLHKGAEESMQDQREHKDGFAYLEAFLDRQSEQSSQTVIKHAMTGPVLATGAATAAQVKPDLNKQLNAVLQTTGPTAKPLDKIDQNKGPGNSEGASNAANNKQQAMQDKKQEITQSAKAIASKMDGQQMQTAMKDNAAPRGVAGMAAEMGLQAAGHPVAAIAVGVGSAINAQGQGTYSTQKTASAPVLSAKEQKKAPYVMSYGEPVATPIAAPAGPSVSAMNKQMGKGPGFGADLAARAQLTGLDEIRMSNVDKMIERSPAMKAATSQLDNAKDVKLALAGMKENGVIDATGKQKMDDKTQEFIKAPAAPAPASFRV